MNVRTSIAWLDPGRAVAMRGSLSNRAELREIAARGGIRRLVAGVASRDHVHGLWRASRRGPGSAARSRRVRFRRLAIERCPMRDRLGIFEVHVERVPRKPARLDADSMRSRPQQSTRLAQVVGHAFEFAIDVDERVTGSDA